MCRRLISGATRRLGRTREEAEAGVQVRGLGASESSGSRKAETDVGMRETWASAPQAAFKIFQGLSRPPLILR